MIILNKLKIKESLNEARLEEKVASASNRIKVGQAKNDFDGAICVDSFYMEQLFLLNFKCCESI